MNEFIIISTLLLVILFGFLITEIPNLLRGYTIFEKVPVWFGVGVGAIAFQLFFYSILAIEWSNIDIFIPWLILGIFYLLKGHHTLIINLKVSHLTFLEYFLLILIILLLFFVGFESVMRPLSAWDGWAIWVLKAKMFYIDDFLNPQVYHLVRENYPFVINLALVFLAKVLGAFDDRSLLLLFYCYYLFSAVAIYGFLKKNSSRLIAFLFTFLFCSTQNVIRHGGRFEAGYADLALGFYILISIISFLRFHNKKTTQNIIILEIILLITSFVKEEGLVFSVICNILIFIEIILARKYRYLVFFLIFVIPQTFWLIFKSVNNLTYSLYQPLTIHIGRFDGILKWVFKEFFNIKNWNLLWLLVFVSLITSLWFKFTKINLILFILSVQFVAYLFIFVVSPHLPEIHVGGTFNRLLLHFAPTATIIIGLVFSRFTKISKSLNN